MRRDEKGASMYPYQLKNKTMVLSSIFFLLAGPSLKNSFASPTQLKAVTKKTNRNPSSIPDKREFPLDQTINPCDDFHKYVCNQVESSFTLREDRSSHTFAFDDSNERILEAKKNFFKNIDQENHLNPRALQIVNFYNACMNPKTSSDDERANINHLILETQKIKNLKQLIQLSHSNLSRGKYSFVAFDSVQNISDPNKYDAFVAVNLMKLPDHSYYDNPELMSDYKNLIISFFKIIDPRLDEKTAEAKAQAMINLEIAFKDIYPKSAIRRQRWSEKREMEKAKFKMEYPNLAFDSMLNLIPDKLSLRVPIPEGLAFFNSILDEKNFQTLKDIYLYRAGSSMMDDAYPEFFNQQFEFSKKYFGGPDKRPERQERCTKLVMQSFTKELDEVMLPRLFPEFPEKKLLDLAAQIRSSILKGLEKNQWLSPEAKAEAIQKMTMAKLQLMKPKTEKEWDFNPILNYSKTKRIENSQKLEMALFKKTMKEITEPVNHDAWHMGPLTVNAYYDPSENKFVMPMGILQYPFFNQEGSLIENLGAVGAVMGHELGHGIDDQGSKFDESGKLRQWMTSQDLAQFSSRSQKLVDQFNRAGHNGALTLGENVADLVGLTFAYQAAFPDGKGNLTDKQNLFISYARVWCNVKRPKYEERLLKTDPHAMGWARINEQVKHQPGFSEAFSCKAGDKLSLLPEDRVVIW